MNKIFYKLILLILLLIIVLILIFSQSSKIVKYNDNFTVDYSNFKNVVLIIVFNHSSCISTIEIIEKMYENYFKKIIYYSDIPEITNNLNINFLKIESGANCHCIFKHFYKNYKPLIYDSDGIFYCMDDCLINVKMLSNINTDKIIINDKNEILNNLDTYSGWQWDNYRWGKTAINNLLNDNNFNKYNISKFAGGFADYFYLPKRYINDNFIEICDKFCEYNVFLELAIPSIIHNIEKNKDNYLEIKSIILWNNDRDLVNDFEYVKKSFNNNTFIIHPVKLKQLGNSYSELILNYFNEN